MDTFNRLNGGKYVSPEVETYTIVPVSSILTGSVKASNTEDVEEGVEHQWA